MIALKSADCVVIVMIIRITIELCCKEILPIVDTSKRDKEYSFRILNCKAVTIAAS